MFRAFYPCEYIDSVFSIDYSKLYAKGYRGIIFDIDSTLVPHGDDSTTEIDELFKKIHNVGFKTLLLSNNSEERIIRFIQNIDTKYISDAQKPDIVGFIKAVDMLKIDKSQVIFVGDQIFTDIYGANKSGIDSILVKYIQHEHETKIGIKRNFEKLILKFYRLNKSYQNKIGNILKGDN